MADTPRYYSASKRDFVEIASMPTPHLSSAAKKLLNAEADRYGISRDEALPVLLAMIDELARRVPAKKVSEGIRAVRSQLEREGAHYPNEMLVALSELVGEEWNGSGWEASNG